MVENIVSRPATLIYDKICVKDQNNLHFKDINLFNSEEYKEIPLAAKFQTKISILTFFFFNCILPEEKSVYSYKISISGRSVSRYKKKHFLPKKQDFLTKWDTSDYGGIKYSLFSV